MFIDVASRHFGSAGGGGPSDGPIRLTPWWTVPDDILGTAKWANKARTTIYTPPGPQRLGLVLRPRLVVLRVRPSPPPPAPCVARLPPPPLAPRVLSLVCARLLCAAPVWLPVCRLSSPLSSLQHRGAVPRVTNRMCSSPLFFPPVTTICGVAFASPPLYHRRLSLPLPPRVRQLSAADEVIAFSLSLSLSLSLSIYIYIYIYIYMCN